MSPLRSSAGPAVCTNGDPELGRDDLGERGLAEPRRPGEQDVVERVPARARRPRSRPPAARSACSWPTNSARRRGRSERSSSSSGDEVRRLDARGVWRSSLTSLIARSPRPRRAQRVRRSAPRRSRPAASAQQLLGLAGRVAELEQARRGRAARGSLAAPGRDERRVASRPRRTPTFSRSSTMIRSAVRLPIPGTAWKRAASPAAIAPISSRGVPRREHRERHLRADRLHRQQHQEEVALLPRARNPYSVERVVAHDEMGVQHRLARRPRARGAASARTPRRGSRRRRTAARRGRAGAPATSPREQRDHAGAPAARPRSPARAHSGARLTWQIATASASAAWSGVGGAAQSEQRLDHARDLVLVGARPCPHTADLTCWGCRTQHGDAALPRGEHHDARAPARRRTRVRTFWPK